VNVICPGYVRTDLNDEWFSGERSLAQIVSFPRGRLMSSADLDGVLVLLLSDASRAITGSVFTVDDGQTL
jgi:NAD(P)-dependent dehydrogenase (short-subunit alcohol dehydrogenase family)